MTVRIVDAQVQARTPCDVRGPWVRPRVPSKRAGRRGTRRAFKRKRCNQPHFVMLYREPTDVLIIHNRTIIATPLQADAMRRHSVPA
jgi:hypothetical protein